MTTEERDQLGPRVTGRRPCDLSAADYLRWIIWSYDGGVLFDEDRVLRIAEQLEAADRLERPGVVGRMFGQSSNEWFIGIDMDARDIVAALGCPLENDMPVKVFVTPAAT